MDLDEVPGDDSVADLVQMPDPNADKANQHRGKPLENLLMAKNRKIQDELTGLRVGIPPYFSTYSLFLSNFCIGCPRRALRFASHDFRRPGGIVIKIRRTEDVERSPGERFVAHQSIRFTKWSSYAFDSGRSARRSEYLEEGYQWNDCYTFHQLRGDFYLTYHYVPARSFPAEKWRTRGGTASTIRNFVGTANRNQTAPSR